MKEYVEKHEAIIDTYYSPIPKDVKEGEVVAHKRIVTSIYLYLRNERDENFMKYYLTREMILDLAEKIKSLEQETKDIEYINLPF